MPIRQKKRKAANRLYRGSGPSVPLTSAFFERLEQRRDQQKLWQQQLQKDTSTRLGDDHNILPSDDTELHWVSDVDSDCGANVSKYLPPSKVNEQNRRQRSSNWEKVHMLFAERLATRQEAVCNCAVLNRQVLLVSASAATKTSIPTCECGALLSNLVIKGYFPAAPLKPTVAFSLDLIDLFHRIITAGSISKLAWTAGLRSFLSEKCRSRIPDLKKLWEYAYFNWIEIVLRARNLVENKLTDLSGHVFHTSSFPDLCPACFFRKDEGNSVAVFSIDGNFQHRRYNFVGRGEKNLSRTALFVNEGDNAAIVPEHPSSQGCSHYFAASDAAPKPSSMANLDETGLMGAVCRHGHPLRYLNMYTGERSASTLSIVREVIANLPHSATPIMQYDIACKFSRSLQLLSPVLFSKMRLALNAFHTYSHELKCQLGWSPLRLEGLGLSDGEGNERDWAAKRHLVSVGRRTGSLNRTTLIEQQSLRMAETLRQSLFQTLHRRYRKAVKIEQDSSLILQRLEIHNSITNETNIDRTYTQSIESLLRNQVDCQKEWFNGEAADEDAVHHRYPHTKIYESLVEEIDLYKRTGQSPDDGTLEDSLSKVIAVTDQLLHASNLSRTDWQSTGKLWEKYSSIKTWMELDKTKLKIRREFSARTLELRHIRTRIAGQKAAQKLVSSLRQRVPKVTKLVERFNRLREDLPPATRPEAIHKDTYSPLALEQHYNQPLWNFEKSRSSNQQVWNAWKWAESSEIAEGIEHLFRRDRAKEEQVIVKQEAKRTYQWVVGRLKALNDARAEDHSLQDCHITIGLLFSTVKSAEDCVKFGQTLLTKEERGRLADLLEVAYTQLPDWRPIDTTGRGGARQTKKCHHSKSLNADDLNICNTPPAFKPVPIEAVAAESEVEFLQDDDNVELLVTVLEKDIDNRNLEHPTADVALAN